MAFHVNMNASNHGERIPILELDWVLGISVYVELGEHLFGNRLQFVLFSLRQVAQHPPT